MDVRVDETVRLDVPKPGGGVERVAITLEHKSGKVARLRIRAADNVTIDRPDKRRELAQHIP